MWVEKFKNLQNIQLNFCSQYQYYFDINRYHLTRDTKAPVPERLLSEHISDITGVLGGNGAGKTNILEMLCLATKAQDEINSRFFLVYEDEGQIYYFDKTEQNKFLIADFAICADKNGTRLQKLNVIYFSNVYDGSDLDLDTMITDISINHRVRSSEIFTPEHEKESQVIDDLHFIYSESFALLDYPRPTTVSVKIFKLFWDRYPKKHLNDFDKGLIRMMKAYFQHLKKTNASMLEHSCVNIQLSLLTKLLTEFDIPEQSTLRKDLKALEIRPSYNSGDIKNIILNLVKTLKKDDQQLKELLYTAANLNTALDSTDFHNIPKCKSTHIAFTLTITQKNISDGEAILKLINYITPRQIEWVELSSGQRAYVNLFSSLWNALQKQKHKFDALICIDEGDLYLHPQLQLEFIDKLVKVLPQLSDNRIQVIITTHSPLLVTDLPGQCLILLTQNEEGITCAKPGGKTFGGNIYDIYRSIFELHSQRTGNLSHGYITQIINILDKPELTASDVEELNASLTIIGDKLLTHHIIKRLNAVSMMPGSNGDSND